VAAVLGLGVRGAEEVSADVVGKMAVQLERRMQSLSTDAIRFVRGPLVVCLCRHLSK
jgi:hypothetical protein